MGLFPSWVLIFFNGACPFIGRLRTDQPGILAIGVASGEGAVVGGSFVVNQSGLYGGCFVATPEGFAVEQMVAIDGGIVDELIAGVVVDKEDEVSAEYA